MKQPPVLPTHRSLTILDGIVIVAALAIALAMVRGWLYPRWCDLPMSLMLGNPSAGRLLHHSIGARVAWSIPFAITLTIALLALRFRSPRPRLRRVAWQPGAVACGAALVAMAARMSDELFAYCLGYLTIPSSPVHLPSPPFTRYDNPAWHRPPGQILHDIVLESFPFLVAPSVGIAVFVAWGVLFATGRWRSEASWLDRSGRLLGVYWILLAVVIAVMAQAWKLLI